MHWPSHMYLTWLPGLKYLQHVLNQRQICFSKMKMIFLPEHQLFECIRNAIDMITAVVCRIMNTGRHAC